MGYDLQVIDDIMPLRQEDYQNTIDAYIESVKTLRNVKAVYQIGSTGIPGISDIDLIVVTEPVFDPVTIGNFSVLRSKPDRNTRYIFIHDMYVYDTGSFKQVHFSNYCDNLNLIYGEEQEVEPVSAEEKAPLALQFLFDFISSRLVQFQQNLVQGKLSKRGTLVRVSSIRHSYALLNSLGIHDPQLDEFCAAVTGMRENAATVSNDEIIDSFMRSFYLFSRIVRLASDYFFETYLPFYTEFDTSNCLKINPHFLLNFIKDSEERYRQVVRETVIYYPEPVLYHYLAYCVDGGVFSSHMKNLLAYSGDEQYSLSPVYRTVLEKRLRAIADQHRFIRKNRASFAMSGYPGFLINPNILF